MPVGVRQPLGQPVQLFWQKVDAQVQGWQRREESREATHPKSLLAVAVRSEPSLQLHCSHTESASSFLTPQCLDGKPWPLKNKNMERLGRCDYDSSLSTWSLYIYKTYP